MNKNTLITPWKTHTYAQLLTALINTLDQLQQQTPYTPKPPPTPQHTKTGRKQQPRSPQDKQ